MRGVIYHRGLRKLWEEGLKFFLEGLSVSSGCQIIKKGAFQRTLCAMWLHLLSRRGWKTEEASKGSRRKRARKGRDFCQGRFRLWSCAGEVPPGFRFCVCILSESSRDFPTAPGAVRKLKQETSFTVLLRITCYVGHGDRLCAVWGTACSRSVGALRQEKPIWTKAEDPSKSSGQSETYWRVPSPKRHLRHPVGISTLGKCPRISSSSFAPFGMKFATKWISRGGRIDSPYLVGFFSREECPPSTLCATQVFKTSRHSRSPVSVPDTMPCVVHTHFTLRGNPVGRVPLFWRWCCWSPENLSHLPKVARFWAELGFWARWFGPSAYVLFASGWECGGWTWWGSPVIVEASGLQM